MNKLTLILLLAFPAILNAQIINNIKKVETLKIYGNGKTVIGQLIIQSARTLIFYRGYKQTVDSVGIYTTEYYFSPLEKLVTFGIDVTVSFDKPIIRNGPFGFEAGPAATGSFSGSTDMPNDSTVSFSGAVNCKCGFAKLKVKSKAPLFATFSGIDGQLQ
jgi:hypothetical protein